MTNKSYLIPIEMQSFNSSSLTGSYQAINSAGFTQPLAVLRLVNDSNQDVTISYDGSTDNDFLRSGDTLQIGAQTNRDGNVNLSNFKKGTKLSIKGSTGTGLLYLTGYYHPN